jgi:hypothetical protein
MLKYIGDLHEYLRRLMGKFSGDNIITTINQQGSITINNTIIGGTGFLELVNKGYHYVSTGSTEAVTVSAEDHRARTFIYGLRYGDGSTYPIQTKPVNYLGAISNWGNGTNDVTLGTVGVGANSGTLKILGSDGSLELTLFGTSEFYLYVTDAVLVAIPDPAGDDYTDV